MLSHMSSCVLARLTFMEARMSDILRALEILKKGRIVDLTHLVHDEIPRFDRFLR